MVQAAQPNLTNGRSGPAHDQLVTAGRQWAPAAQPSVVSEQMGTAQHGIATSFRRLAFGALGAIIIVLYVTVAIHVWLRGSSGWSEFFRNRYGVVTPIAAVYLVWQALPQRVRFGGARRGRREMVSSRAARTRDDAR